MQAIYHVDSISIESKPGRGTIPPIIEIILGGGPRASAICLQLAPSTFSNLRRVLDEGCSGEKQVALTSNSIAYPSITANSLCVETFDEIDGTGGKRVAILNIDLCWQLRRLLPEKL